jgi:hypothetical protein
MTIVVQRTTGPVVVNRVVQSERIVVTRDNRGPVGLRGPSGAQGLAGDGADPGDLTLIFNNQLI